MKKRNVYLIGILIVVMVFGNISSSFAGKEADSVVCGKGILKIGEMDADVREKCGKPNRQSMSEWAYDDVRPSFTVYFEKKKVVRILVIY